MKNLMMMLLLASIASCAKISKDDLKKMIKENPEIITDSIEANPSAFIESLNKAVKNAQADQAKKQEDEEAKKLEESYNNPLVAKLRSDELFRGEKEAPITLVEYSDFECPFCSRGFATVMEVMEKYKGKIRFVYKHLPLSFHPHAMPAAKYYEAMRLQSGDLAIKFHDEIYKNQKELQSGEGFLKAVAKKLGANMDKLAKDVASKEVENRIAEDMKEAGEFGFQGTPGFLLNGVPVRGAYPLNHFEGIVNELVKRGKITL